MDLPKDLVNQTRTGRVVLFLGAGASRGARNRQGKEPPLANDLRDLLVGRFLTDAHASDNLAWVSELASSTADPFTVQDFIADQFTDLTPAEFHHLIPTFRWRGMATTNYDRLVESVYAAARQPVQSIVPFLSDSDRVDEKLRNPSAIALLKLHGCITRTHDEKLPLILTVDQYATYREARIRLFQMFEEWASENTVVFIGHTIQDSNLRAILLNLTQMIPSRPRYYLVRRGLDVVERDLWAGKNITALDGTFEEFLNALDSAIPKEWRPLLAAIEVDHPIRSRFGVRDKASPALIEFLGNDVEYIHEGIAVSEGAPAKFYSGFGLGWYPILKNLDARRRLTDQVLEDVILRPEEDRPSQSELYVIKAEAGAGKSVLLRRIAWDAATKAGVLCLFSRGTTSPSFEALGELSGATGERIFYFIDNAADHVGIIRGVLEFARARKIGVTLITTERSNEWNNSCESIEGYMSDQFQLHYLSRAEIEGLVHLLTEHNALGPFLTGKKFEDQVNEFEKKAGRQLLVALHEATHGRPFEEILLDEYRNIVPAEAQRLYLSVCVLNRLKVPVRAGLISRVHGIRFEDFRTRLFKPLEHVIAAVPLSWGDYAYMARHSEIAQIVFEEVLTDPTERFNEYIRVIKCLNPLYASDREALRGMLRARIVDALFANYEDANAIYEAARETLKDDPYFLQQRGIYERIRDNGNLRLARSLLERARDQEPRDSTIIHTLATIMRSQAEESEKPLERARFRNEARTVLQHIDPSAGSARYAIVTRLNLATDELRELLASEQSADRAIDEAVRAGETIIEVAKQRYPSDPYVLVAESGFAKLLEDHERSVETLKRARKANPRDPYIASRLASILVSKGDHSGARICIEEALESNQGDRRLQFQYAEMLRKQGEIGSDELAYHYRKAFVQSDENYDSKFWFARYAFESKDAARVDEARKVFRQLRDVPMMHENRIRLLDTIGGIDDPKMFGGVVKRVEATHGFITVDGRGDDLFFHRTDLEQGVWEQLKRGTRVLFGIGFNLAGPLAVKLRLE